jgi:hypothetical protein
VLVKILDAAAKRSRSASKIINPAHDFLSAAGLKFYMSIQNCLWLIESEVRAGGNFKRDVHWGGIDQCHIKIKASGVVALAGEISQERRALTRCVESTSRAVQGQTTLKLSVTISRYRDAGLCTHWTLRLYYKCKGEQKLPQRRRLRKKSASTHRSVRAANILNEHNKMGGIVALFKQLKIKAPTQ